MSKLSAEEKAAAKRANQKIQYQSLLEELNDYSPSNLMPLQTLRDSGFISKAAKLGPKYLGDLVIAISQKFNELSQFDRNRIQKVIEEERSELIEIGEVAKKEGKKKKATYSNYIEVFEKELGDIRRDIFTGDLHCYEPESKVWVQVLNHSDHLKGVIRDLSIEGPLEYTSAAVEEHLATLKRNLKPELIIDIPEWDGSDRIKEACSYIHLKPDKGVSHEAFEEYTREWLANVFKKLIDPTLESFKADEFILILSGNQGIGKDYWVKSLLCSLGQWFSRFQVLHNERDVYMQLHEALVLLISEFDRTAKLDSGTLKDVVTCDHTRLRASYDKRAEFRHSHASFIATCNITDIFRDHTGARRYAPFELESIDWDFEIDPEFSLQILAQAMHLARKNYKVSVQSKKEIQGYRDLRTPEDFDEYIVEQWEIIVRNILKDSLNSDSTREILTRGWISNEEAENVFKALSDRTGMTLRMCQRALSNFGLRERNQIMRGYYLERNVNKLKNDAKNVSDGTLPYASVRDAFFRSNNSLDTNNDT